MKISSIFKTVAAVCVGVALQSNANAQLNSYSQNFDSLDASDANALSGDGWNFFSDNAGSGAYNGGAPNGGNISNVANDGNGNQYINFFANYGNNAVHDDASRKEAISLFQQQSFTAGEAAAGDTWQFDFSFAGNPGAPLTTTDVEVGAFIRVFDGSFNLLDEQTFDTFTTNAAFTDASLSQTLNAAWTNGGIVQFGFNNLVGEYNPSGVFYDNVAFSNTAAVPEPSSALICGLIGLGVFARRRR